MDKISNKEIIDLFRKSNYASFTKFLDDYYTKEDELSGISGRLDKDQKETKVIRKGETDAPK